MNEWEHVLSHPVVLLMLFLLSETSFSSNLVTLELIVLSLNLMCHFLLESSITSSYVHSSSAPVVPVNIIQFGNHCFKSVIFLPLQGEPESSVSLIHSFTNSNTLEQLLWTHTILDITDSAVNRISEALCPQRAYALVRK